MLKEGPVWALGTMSGTSLDGVDAAMVLSDGSRVLEFGESAYRPYSRAERAVLREALGMWAGMQEAAEIVENAHAELLARFSGYDLVGFHGQTVAHEPGGRGTRQVGNGALLAEVLGKPVVWDFRSADVQMGGQGAPLAPFYHFALAKHLGEEAPLAFLNIGGIANVTWADPRKAAPEEAGALLAFDTGPGNAPLDDLVHKRLGVAFDEKGSLAARGRVDDAILERFASEGYFLRIPPKSLDRGAFPTLAESMEGLTDADAAATLTAAVATGVARAAEHFPSKPQRVLVAGGGRHNRTMMAMIAAGLGQAVAPVEEAGLDGDMLEAQAFAHLAVRVARGLPTSAPGTTGVAAAIGGGQVSLPSGRFQH